MKRRICSVLVLAAAAATGLAQQPGAQPPPSGSTKPAAANPTVNQEMLQRALTEGRRKLFSAGMNLTPQEYEVFWGIYGDFEKERNALDAVRIALLRKVAERYGKATGTEALGIVAESADLQQKEIALRKKYADAIGQKVNASAGVRFWQIDDYITTALRLDLLDDLPLFQETKAAAGN